MLALRRKENGQFFLRYSGPGGAWLWPMLRVMKPPMLELNRGMFAGAGINWLERMPFLHGLHLVDWKITDAAALRSLKELRYLYVSAPFVRGIERNWFDHLTELGADFAGAVSGLRQPSALKRLFLGELKDETIEWISLHSELEELQLATAGFKTTDGLSLERLSSLTLKGACSIQGQLNLSGCPNLTDILLIGVPHLGSLSSIAGLEKLESLVLLDCGRIESLKPLLSLGSLRKLAVGGSTKILDGALKCLLSMKNLKSVQFADSKSYDITHEEFLHLLTAS